MLPVVAVILFVLGLLALAVYIAELQTTIAFVIDRGGLWLDYSSGVGRVRISGFQIRMASGRAPRAWKRSLIGGKPRKTDFNELIYTLTHRTRKPVNLPLGSLVDIGVKIIIRELNVNAKIGVEDDAAVTALICGMLETLAESARAVSTRGEFVPRGRIRIRPVFNAGRLSVRFKCILAVKARHIIREVIQSHTRRDNDGKSSNRKHHADHDGKHTQHG